MAYNAPGAGDFTPAPIGPTQLTCTLCGQLWDKTASVLQPHTPAAGHTEADWDAWRIAQGYPDGAPYPRFALVNPPPQPGP